MTYPQCCYWKKLLGEPLRGLLYLGDLENFKLKREPFSDLLTYLRGTKKIVSYENYFYKVPPVAIMSIALCRS